MPYLEIYPIENSADKIAKQLDLVLDAKPTMYAKTKDRYRKLAQSLLQSVEKISSILEEESLVSDSDYISEEFDELSDGSNGNQDSVLYAAVASAKNQVTSYTQFNASASKGTQHVERAVMSNKEVFSKIAEVLSEASTHHFKCIQATECAALIYKWFECRFVSNNNKDFKYSLKQVPVWITYLIILYGKYQSIGRLPEFYDMINNWCIQIREQHTTWAVPYEVHELMSSVNPDDFTLNAAIIGDVLIDECYYKLTSTCMSGSSIYLYETPAFIIKQKNPSLSRKIALRFAKQQELADECNLIWAIEPDTDIDADEDAS